MEFFNRGTSDLFTSFSSLLSSSSSVKLSRMLLSMLRTTAGCQVGREDKHWQGTSIVLSSYNNQRIRASFDFPTVWVSPLWQHLVQTSNHMLFLLLYITVSPPLRIFFQTVGRGNFCAWGAESVSWMLGLKEAGRWKDIISVLIVFRGRYLSSLVLVFLWDQRCGIHPAQQRHKPFSEAILSGRTASSYMTSVIWGIFCDVSCQKKHLCSIK